MFDYPNPLALTGFLRARLEGAEPGPIEPVSAPANPKADEPIAIIGLDARFGPSPCRGGLFSGSGVQRWLVPGPHLRPGVTALR